MPKLRNILLFALTAAAVGMAYPPLRDLFSAAARKDYYSHILLIPFITAYLLISDRKKIFAKSEFQAGGACLCLAGLALYLWGMGQDGSLNRNDHASLQTFSAVVFWVGGFAGLMGWDAFRKASFPLGFLLFAVPVPEDVIRQIISFLQVGSTELAGALFTMARIPFVREGFVFHLPALSIEIAEECSGIRSSLGLLLTGILASRLFLKANWRKGALIASVLPLAILKNAIRILTLTWLAMRVDMGFLTGGFLHQSGGFLFFLPALGLMGILLFLLRKGEKKKEQGEG